MSGIPPPRSEGESLRFQLAATLLRGSILIMEICDESFGTQIKAQPPSWCRIPSICGG